MCPIISEGEYILLYLDFTLCDHLLAIGPLKEESDSSTVIVALLVTIVLIIIIIIAVNIIIITMIRHRSRTYEVSRGLRHSITTEDLMANQPEENDDNSSWTLFL